MHRGLKHGRRTWPCECEGSEQVRCPAASFRNCVDRGYLDSASYIFIEVWQVRYDGKSSEDRSGGTSLINSQPRQPRGQLERRIPTLIAAFNHPIYEHCDLPPRKDGRRALLAFDWASRQDLDLTSPCSG